MLRPRYNQTKMHYTKGIQKFPGSVQEENRTEALLLMRSFGQQGMTTEN